ncbi:MAG: EamA family transporter [Scytonema sp. PMC 1069.18]|nr:EamA family transporter [Scytonema sp. PMC 1069.18]MEC4885133.1 EamA family transporter [Scytonema sp. PMC 1070.18]
MGRFERRPENLRGKGDPLGAAESAIRAVTEELQLIQRNLLKSLQDDVRRLQAEKDRLTDDITRLQQEKEKWQQSQHITEQQALIHQLSQVLANHISSQLQSSLETLTNQATQRISQPSISQETTQTQNTEKLLGSLDDSLTIAFSSLQQELRNYQSSLSQQLSRMYNQQQQGEVILAELVNRLQSELTAKTYNNVTTLQSASASEDDDDIAVQPQQGFFSAPTKLQLDIDTPQEETVFLPPPATQTVTPTSVPEPVPSSPPPATQAVTPTSVPQPVPSASPPPATQAVSPTSVPEPVPSSPPPATQAVSPTSVPEPVSSSPISTEPEKQVSPKETTFRQIGISSLSQVGILLIVLSTVASSLYNVAIKVIFHPSSQVFGVFEVENLVLPTLGNSLLLLMLRMLVVVPLLMVLAPILHPRVWHDVQYLFDSVQRNANNAAAKRALILSVISGSFLFLSQLFIYLSIGQIPTGMAIALFFVYPILSGLFSWVLFRDRPTLFSTGAIVVIGLGELLVLGGAIGSGIGNTPLGSLAAIISGIAFSLYIILSRICANKVHPVTFTLINFSTMMLLCLIGLILPLPSNWSLQINPATFLELVLSAFILGVLTLFSYLLNNIGVRKVGASRAAIIGATVPAITVILAGFIIQETLHFEQVLGVLLVTCGAGTLCFDKIRNRLKPLK